jgi:hypothetical protein
MKTLVAVLLVALALVGFGIGTVEARQQCVRIGGQIVCY